MAGDPQRDKNHLLSNVLCPDIYLRAWLNTAVAPYQSRCRNYVTREVEEYNIQVRNVSPGRLPHSSIAYQLNLA